MVRKLALAVSLALGTLSVPVHALGLGELSSKSTLNQNFRGDINLLSVKADELETIRVKLADQAAFSRAGVERPFYLTLLKFEPTVTGRGKPVIQVTSEFPIREPFLNFLIEVNWPNGRLLREYTVLLDPPTTTRRRPPVVTQASKQAAPATRPAPARVAAPAPSAPVASFDGGEYGPVQANDTAWSIAKQVRPGGVSMEQMMMALLNANPQAFINNDINRLRRGRILRVPALAEIQQLSRAQARAAYREQQDAWLARRDAKLRDAAQAQADSESPAAPLDDAASAVAETPDQLRIATARPEGSGEAGAGDDDAVATTPSDLKSRLIAARENAETSRQEAETLRSRVDDLQARLQDMQRLLSLKDEQLAQLQDSVATGELDAAGAETPAELPLSTSEAPTADVAVADEVAPDAAVEQAVDEAAAAVDATVMAGSEAEVVIETGLADTAEPVADVAQAIDDAVADLVGGDAATATQGVLEDYRIEDIPPQVDPDRIVRSGGVVETPQEAAEAAAEMAGSMAELDLGIPKQIDPDRIVLGLDSAPGVPDAEQMAPAVEPAADIAAMPGEEVVIEGIGEPAAESEMAPAEAAAEPEIAVAPAAEPTPPAVPAAEPSTASDGASGALIPPAIASMVEKNIVPIAGGGIVLLGLLGWLFTRGGRKEETGDEMLAAAAAGAPAATAEAPAEAAPEQPVDEPILNAQTMEDMPDSAFLDDFSPSDINALQDETGEVDPVSEADVYIAYGRYQQAEELLRQAMERDPDRLALKHKLLEVHYATRDADAYGKLAQDMVDAGQDSVDDEAWARAQDMGRELDPDNPLFALQSGTEGGWSGAASGAAAAATAGAAVGAAANTVDSDSLTLDDLEISELTAAYDEDTGADDLEAPSEVSITLDLDESSQLSSVPPEPARPEPASLDNLEPLEFELPNAEGDSSLSDTVDSESISDTLDLDSMMAEAEAAVDQDKSELSLDSDFSAAELQAQLDELSDLSALDSNLEDAPAEPGAPSPAGLGLVAEDTGSAGQGLDEPLSLDTAFDANVGDDEGQFDTLELDDDSEASADEVATKLDLARAYVEMGDDDGARSILEEVVTEGDDGQRGEAKQILSQLG